ncbi:MAG: TadE family protein [Actinomycetota bacterium]
MNRERGATLVEAAFAAPIFLVIVLSLIELSLVAHNTIEVSDVAQRGVRAAGVYDSQRHADHEVLDAVTRTFGRIGTSDIDYVVIFRIESVGDEMNPQCHVTSVSLASDPQRPCNRYAAADLARPYVEADGVTPTPHFGCGPSSLDQFWCPADRQTSVAGNLDLVGVHIAATHRYLTGVIGATRGISGLAITQVEPRDA